MTGRGIVMCVDVEFLHNAWLDIDLFEEEFFQSMSCEVAFHEKYKIILSKTYRVPSTSKKEFLEIFTQKMRLVHFHNYSMIILEMDQSLDFLKLS